MTARLRKVWRWAMVAIGLVLLAWLPLSWTYAPQMSVAVSGRTAGIASLKGTVRLWIFTSVPFELRNGFRWDYRRGKYRESNDLWRVLCPYGNRFNSRGFARTFVSIPLWLLAALSLAGPIVSILRRRRDRWIPGFPVLLKDGAAATTRNESVLGCPSG